MNRHVRPVPVPAPWSPPRQRPTTQAAEGLPRWRWTTEELIHLTGLGFFDVKERIELIGGEIVPMSPIGRRHKVVSEDLEILLRARQTADAVVVNERQFDLDDVTYTTPDLMLRPASIKAYDLTGPTVLLVIEVADSSLAYDLNTKAKLYASFGVREYWVIDAQSLETRVHRVPSATGYADVSTVGKNDPLVPLLAPALTVRLREIDPD